MRNVVGIVGAAAVVAVIGCEVEASRTEAPVAVAAVLEPAPPGTGGTAREAGRVMPPPPPPQPGDLPFSTSEHDAPVEADKTVKVDVYVPDPAGKYPVVVLRHGLTRSKDNLIGWGQQMATRGFVAIMQNARTPGSHDADAEALDMLAVLKWASTTAPFAAKVDGTRAVLGGHSAGGLAALVAASQSPSIRALVLLDPEANAKGEEAARKVRAPTIDIFADPTAIGDNPLASTICIDTDGAGPSNFRSLAGPRLALRIKGASHCAPEIPSGKGCEALCGAASPQAQDVFRRYVMAFLGAYVACNRETFSAVDPKATPLDPSAQILTNDSQGGPSDVCPK